MTTVYIISAPSGSGKSTLVKKVRQIVPGLKFSISYTTRPPRGAIQRDKLRRRARQVRANGPASYPSRGEEITSTAA